jgi:RNA recognition motif-containing protein
MATKGNEEGKRSMNIYAGNLSYETGEADLRQAFEAFGKVANVKIILDKASGKSRGFGFVEMPTKEEGDAAINGLNGKDLKGRNLVVNEARPRTEGRREGGFSESRSGGRGGAGRPGGGRGDGGRRGGGPRSGNKRSW